METAVFAGGCFWCMEAPFRRLDGVVAVTSGYTGGTAENPTYAAVTAGGTGHREAVEVRYDPARVSYERLLEVFWRQIDPTDAGGQFVDRGSQYRAAVFWATEGQRRLAERSKARLARSRRFAKPIVTEILPASRFWPAEAHHQGFARANPERYKYYRWGSGRDEFLEKVWGAGDAGDAGEPAPPAWHGFVRPDDAELRRRLTPLQYAVTQEGAEEPAFEGGLWDEWREGVYVDVVSGEPLFFSRDKYDAGTGRPSFARPIEQGVLIERAGAGPAGSLAELRSRHAESHVGHLFPDGPAPTCRRYSASAAALRFVPRERMERAGYGDYLLLFEG